MKLAVKNGRKEDTCYNETGLYAQCLKQNNEHTMERVCDHLKREKIKRKEKEKEKTHFSL
jgi:hypothetical protein